MIRKIAVTGPESTGKSELSRKLADHYQTVWVKEFAREYLNVLDRPYREQDILEIARGQVREEEKKADEASGYLFCDTELIVTKIWSDVKYGRCDPWIINQIRCRKYDLFLLCDIDLPWEFDPMREHPHKRQFLFDLYERELRLQNKPYRVIRGIGDQRLAGAVRVMEDFFRD